ncbi:LysR family transcriptional regulator, partial [Acinetobacter baumannii]
MPGRADRHRNLKSALQNFSFRELLIFEAVVRGGSLSAAARRRQLTPPLVTKSIQRLEESLGLRLFVRSHRGVSLTGEGQAFL